MNGYKLNEFRLEMAKNEKWMNEYNWKYLTCDFLI